MKLVTFKPRGGRAHLGAIVGDQVINLAEVAGGKLPDDMRSFLELGEDGLRQARKVATKKAAGEHGVALSSVKLMAPIMNPSKVLAIGLNYMDHIRETNSKVPSIPVMFTKLTSSIIGPTDAIRWSPEETAKVDWEVELGLVIGKQARHGRKKMPLITSLAIPFATMSAPAICKANGAINGFAASHWTPSVRLARIW